MRRWLLLAETVIVIVALAGCQAPAASILPVVDTPMDGPTVIDVPVEVVSTSVVTPAGTTIAADGVTVKVPAGGVTGDTTVVVTRLDAPFRMNPYEPSGPTDVAATAIGHAYDFGPAGVRFAKPVDVTLPYDPGYVPDGTDPTRIDAAYFDGTRWVVAGGTVDPAAHTVTVRLQAFDGSVLVAILIGLGIGGAYVGIRWLFGGEGVRSDPISEGRANEWVVPSDPAVVAWAAQAVVLPRGNGEVLTDQAVPLKSDPTDEHSPLVDWAQQGRAFALSFRPGCGLSDAGACADSSGEPIRMKGRSSFEGFANWQKPADYYGKNDLRGDCTDMTNAWVSVLRSLGYQAKGVFGYARTTNDNDQEVLLPHVWPEVIIGGLPFIMDEDGWFWPLVEGIETLKLVRAGPDDERNAMWDETGQTPYVERWWLGPEVPAESASPTPSIVDQVPLDPGWELATSVLTSDPADPGDSRLYVTITRAYEFEGRNLVTIAVFEYRFVDGRLNERPSERVFFTEVTLNAAGSGDPVADGIARAAEATDAYIAEQGLLPGLPLCAEGQC